MSVKKRTPFIYSDRKPLGAVKKFPSPLARKPVSLEFNGGCTVLSIKASNSVLSEKALQAFKYAFLRNQKIGIGSLPSDELPSQIELDKATAAYEIARKLVDWFEEFCVEEDDSHDLESNTEEEHRSCDLKKDESLFPRSGIDVKKENCISNFSEFKVLNFHTEIKDLDLDFTNDLFPLEPDIKGAPLLDSVFKESATCEAMDFFEPLDTCEMQWNPKFDGLSCNGFDVDISVGAVGSTVPLFNDSENLHDNLTSPISSPGSPVSPYSPLDVLL